MQNPLCNQFKFLSEINVSEYVERKGQFSYLSWPYAVSQLRLADPQASWEVKRFEGLPYLKTEAGHFVEVAVTVQGVTLSQIHPVLDSRNRPIASPTSFDINTSIQRCLVKAIALHGLGLYIYAGEDLPESEKGVEKVETLRPKLSSEQQATILARFVDIGGDLERLLAYFKVKSLADIPAGDYDRVIRSLDRGRKAA